MEILKSGRRLKLKKVQAKNRYKDLSQTQLIELIETKEQQVELLTSIVNKINNHVKMVNEYSSKEISLY
jgi:hypothetical protein